MMNLFAEVEADTMFADRLQSAKAEVETLDDDSLSRADDETSALRILSMVRLDPLSFRFADAHISTHERMIPAEDHPGHRFSLLDADKSYPRQIIRYHLPFDGDAELLECIPNPRILWSAEVEVATHEVMFDIVNWSSNPEDVKREAEQIFGSIRQQHQHLAKQVEAFNANAQSQILQLLTGRRAKLKKASDFVAALGLPVRESPAVHTTVLQKSHRFSHPQQAHTKNKTPSEWDAFISHASEDKQSFVRELANALQEKGLRVWYDEFTLTLGDSLRRSIDQGLANSRFGIVVLSQNFFAKEWPQKELDGLVAREVSSGKLILPIWHNVSKQDVVAISPILADRLAVSSERGIEQVVNEILTAMKKRAS